MTASLAARRRALLTLHPEWWIALLALVAAATTLLPRLTAAAPAAIHTTFYCPIGHEPQDASWLTYGEGVVVWSAMTVAMMLPANLGAIRYVAFSSLRTRRDSAIAWFALAFVLQWLPVGLVLALWHAWRQDVGGAAAGALVLAALWELTPWKATALNACRKTTPIRIRGSAARASCVAYGSVVGRRCLVSCGPAMAALTLAGHPILLLVGAAPLMICEKRRVRAGPWRAGLAVLLLVGAVLVLS